MRPCPAGTRPEADESHGHRDRRETGGTASTKPTQSRRDFDTSRERARLAGMALLATQADRASETFARRRALMEGLVAELRERTATVARGGGPRAVERHRSRGKLTARERIDRLLDPGSAFLELNALAAWDLYDGQAPAAGIVTGIGVIEGRECVVVANDATVKGGSYFPLTVKKHLRAQEVARQNRLPASTSSTPAAPSSRSRPRSSPTATTSAASSSTRRACPRSGSRRSRPSWGRARPEARTCPP